MYETFFGFREKPFNVTSDPSFLFHSRHHQEAFNHLVYGITERKGFLVITGEIGAGKTTICKALLNKLDTSVTTALILNPQLSESQLLKAILTDFGCDAAGTTKFALLAHLNAFLLEQVRCGKNAVLIIDEAQTIKPRLLEQIRLLSNLETEKQKLIQIVLVGQPELRTKLAKPELLQLKQRISVNYHLPPLSNDETHSYINHRLTVAGSSPKNIIFELEALKSIYVYTQGTPRIINLLCDKALLAAFAFSTKTITLSIIERCINELEGNYSDEYYQRSLEESLSGTITLSTN